MTFPEKVTSARHHNILCRRKKNRNKNKTHDIETEKTPNYFEIIYLQVAQVIFWQFVIVSSDQTVKAAYNSLRNQRLGGYKKVIT